MFDYDLHKFEPEKCELWKSDMTDEILFGQRAKLDDKNDKRLHGIGCKYNNGTNS